MVVIVIHWTASVLMVVPQVSRLLNAVQNAEQVPGGHFAKIHVGSVLIMLRVIPQVAIVLVSVL